ncbi:rod shape-determining protein RodA [Pokkaliibacter plantistimulans]|uniref:Peptidoglycan glycosyltransferase MrdB n=1 Tax=Proteobacteria bacterium 228 TaxID=2083153 RepID=A0A2S5KVW9_9PROT|nr:rod shape-determining protein RodA [Pokkaliibacter plantistimulans]PPC79001.1 rod shape-determining protein RodA [Pokkaliibacter plantistimulans]
MKQVDFQRSLQGGADGFAPPPTIWQKLHLDPWLMLPFLLLMGYGLIILYSASEGDMGYVERQALRFLMAFMVMWGFAWIPPRYLRNIAPWLYAFVVGLLLAVLLVGVGAKGAQRWLEIPGLPRFQPAELMKLVLPMTIALWLSNKKIPPRFSHIIIGLLIIAIPVLMIAKQPDLGTSILIAASGVFAILLAGVPWRWVLLALGAAISALPGLWMVMREYQRQRVLTFLDPESDPLGSGWNIIQSKTAIGSGGLFGKGWMAGTQSQLHFLPESHTDFIVAVLGEEFGFVGIAVLLCLYMMILARGLYLSTQAEDLFGRLLSGSLVLTFFVYIFVNIGMVSGLLPVVGVPLPLVSYGGTSVVTLMTSFGMVMSVYSHRSRQGLMHK